MADGWLDLRSDTVTRPTAEMRRAMADADVGDDEYGEDPTVNLLQAEFAARVGKDAAVFVPSGTMGNQLALRLLTRPGDLVVAGARQHVVIYEHGAASKNAGVQLHLVDDTDGTLSPDAVRWAVAARADHQPEVGLVCVENTHMPASGAPWPLDVLEAVSAVASEARVPLHMDGARLFNAAVALKRPARDFVRNVDSVTFCISKGLAAPVGSVICGSAGLIDKARRVRKMLGGGMRQAGVIAAAGIVALEKMVDRLAEDHTNARALAEGLAKLPGLSVDLASVQTNIVIFRVERGDAAASAVATSELVAGCGARKVKIHAIGPTTIRCVTHKDIDAEDIKRTLDAFAEITRRR
jgi:threonine aldolase